jgi:hypothetical protein
LKIRVLLQPLSRKHRCCLCATCYYAATTTTAWQTCTVPCHGATLLEAYATSQSHHTTSINERPTSLYAINFRLHLSCAASFFEVFSAVNVLKPLACCANYTAHTLPNYKQNGGVMFAVSGVIRVCANSNTIWSSAFAHGSHKRQRCRHRLLVLKAISIYMTEERIGRHMKA